MHVLAPKPPDENITMFFNVDASVGHLASNASQEDVMLVQLLIRLNAEHVPASGPSGVARTSRMRAVPLTGICDSGTIDGITAVQESMREKIPTTVVDGRVSPARHFDYGGGYWTIVALNAFIRRHCPGQWPRLHDFGICPGLLKVRIPEIL